MMLMINQANNRTFAKIKAALCSHPRHPQAVEPRLFRAVLEAPGTASFYSLDDMETVQKL